MDVSCRTRRCVASQLDLLICFMPSKASVPLFIPSFLASTPMRFLNSPNAWLLGPCPSFPAFSSTESAISVRPSRIASGVREAEGTLKYLSWLSNTYRQLVIPELLRVVHTKHEQSFGDDWRNVVAAHQPTAFCTGTQAVAQWLGVYPCHYAELPLVLSTLLQRGEYVRRQCSSHLRRERT
jgi:hypothetical protein